MAWAGRQVVVTLPEHIAIANAGQIREELLSVINRGAQVLIADMTATISCDHAGADAVVRAWQRAAGAGTELRLVVTAKIVSRVLDLRGLDRMVSVYPSLEAALAARPPAAAAVRAAVFPAAASSAGNGTTVARARAGKLPGVPRDAMALTDGEGMIAAASARMEAMFGYGRGELPGLPAESLVPTGLQEPQRGRLAVRARMRPGRPVDAGAQVAGVRKDGTTFPVRVSFIPITTASGHFTVAVIRDAGETGRGEDLAGLARDTAAVQQGHLPRPGAVIAGLSRAWLSVQATGDISAGAARQRTRAALGDIIRQIRGTVFPARDQHVPPARLRLAAVTGHAGGRSQTVHGAGFCGGDPVRPARRRRREQHVLAAVRSVGHVTKAKIFAKELPMKQILFPGRCSSDRRRGARSRTAPAAARTSARSWPSASTIPGRYDVAGPRKRWPGYREQSGPGKNPTMQRSLTSACQQAINDDERLVHRWRVRQFTGLGVPGPLAQAVAGHADWHQAANLLQHGCPPRLAVHVVR